MTVRIVQVKFEEEHQGRIMDTLAAAEKTFPKMPGVVGFQCAPASPDNEEYDFAFLVEFDAFEDVEDYFHSKAHQDFANEYMRPFGTIVAKNYEL